MLGSLNENPSVDSRPFRLAPVKIVRYLDDTVGPRGLRAFEFADMGKFAHGFGHCLVDFGGLFVWGYEHYQESCLILPENEGWHTERSVLFDSDGVGLSDVF